jgi:hypothetical protein
MYSDIDPLHGWQPQGYNTLVPLYSKVCLSWPRNAKSTQNRINPQRENWR